MGREYDLVDVGADRRLERFGDMLIDLPAPGALGPPRAPEAWAAAAATFDHGAWSVRRPFPDPWLVAIDGLLVELAPTDTGQVGVFPEHALAWAWLRDRVVERLDRSPVRVLHLFAYTGATTLAAAAAGADVAHVDASRPAVAWARRNAAHSGLADRPIRWLIDDAPAFVAREVRRDRRYDIVVLDPPSYGHGPRGRAWRLHDHLDSLLRDCVRCLSEDGCLLLTAHTTGLDALALADRVRAALAESAGPTDPARVSGGDLALQARSGAHLPLGAWAVAGGPPLGGA
jgi:23S rRNA (cytosine1962-C5)-methyltransferase